MSQSGGGGWAGFCSLHAQRHKVNTSMPPSWAYIIYEIISGRTGLHAPVFGVPTSHDAFTAIRAVLHTYASALGQVQNVIKPCLRGWHHKRLIIRDITHHIDKKKHSTPHTSHQSMCTYNSSHLATLCVSVVSRFVTLSLLGVLNACVAITCRKAAALLTATVGKASRQNSVTPSKRVDWFQVLS